MDDWEDRLALLEEMPRYVAGLGPSFPGDLARERPGPDAFSYVEHVWHLADLESEGFGERIRRLLAEHSPDLPDFDGARIAAERDYRARDVAEGLAAFFAARSRNLWTLRQSTGEDRARGGMQQGVGPVRLGDIPLRMREHDDSHRGELEELRRRFERGGRAS